MQRSTQLPDEIHFYFSVLSGFIFIVSSRRASNVYLVFRSNAFIQAAVRQKEKKTAKNAKEQFTDFYWSSITIYIHFGLELVARAYLFVVYATQKKKGEGDGTE